MPVTSAPGVQADTCQPMPRLDIRDLLRPHRKALILGFFAVIGDGLADLLQPWPLKIVIDHVVKGNDLDGWLNNLIASTVGDDRLQILKVAAIAALVIAVIGALCNYAQKYLTTTV